MTDEQDKSDREGIRKELIKELAEKLAHVITRVVVPEAFIVYEDDMRAVMVAYMAADRMKDKDRRTQALVDAVEHMWRNSKALSTSDMAIMVRGLELAEAEEEANKAKETEPKPNDE